MKLKHIKEGGGIIIPIPCNYSDCLNLVRSDWYRYSGISPSLLRILYGLRNVHTAYSFWLRFSAHKGWLYPITRRMLNYYSRKYGLLIEPQTLIGYGLYLSHHFGIVVNPTAIIGNNVNLSQFTTIGSNEGRAAIIGDEVYIGPNACIVEDVVISKGCVIGAGAVVVKNTSMKTTVGGVPGKKISSNNSARFIKNKWVL